MKNWKNISQDLIKFLQWFQPMEGWKRMMRECLDFVIIQFHITVIAFVSKFLQGYSGPFMKVYSESGETILNRKEDYLKIQRYIFEQNKTIPKEVWPREGFLYDDRLEYEIYYERSKSASNLFYWKLRLDSQDPYSMEEMQTFINEEEKKIR